ncbi:MAG: hypothetical protein ATN31_02085 [Candidatus Epulonipiscioides saccharophilum]|nr:MAG: hypothetical protein ATN31_02085 [Epulopiscium sp. AS2M-Bin001]
MSLNKKQIGTIIFILIIVMVSLAIIKTIPKMFMNEDTAQISMTEEKAEPQMIKNVEKILGEFPLDERHNIEAILNKSVELINMPTSTPNEMAALSPDTEYIPSDSFALSKLNGLLNMDHTFFSDDQVIEYASELDALNIAVADQIQCAE